MLSKLYYPIASLHTKQSPAEVRHAFGSIDSTRWPLLSTRLKPLRLWRNVSPSWRRIRDRLLHVSFFAGAEQGFETQVGKNLSAVHDRRHWRKERIESLSSLLTRVAGRRWILVPKIKADHGAWNTQNFMNWVYKHFCCKRKISLAVAKSIFAT